MSQTTSESRIAVLPRRLDELLGVSIPCGCGRTHEATTRGAVVRPGAIDELPAWVRDVGGGLSVVVVVDRRTRLIAGERVFALLASDGHRPGWCELPDGAGGRPHADEGNLDLVQRALSRADLAVAVGAGTINDLAKLASYNTKIPYLAVATAPSMNGYTSGIAAVMLQGVKRTVDCHQPHAVIADMDVVCTAPAELVAAGLGDLESKPTATADFRLAGRLRGDYYCPAPEGVVLGAEPRVAEAAEGVATGDPAALTLLTEALLLSGMSMKLAGSSSPASGGEHLISHHWDMTAEDEGRVEGWHGAQVGVTTVTTAALYERLAEMSADEIDVDAVIAARPDEEACRERIFRHHGRRAAEIAPEFFAKRLTDTELRAELFAIRDGWDDLWSNLGQVLRPAARIRSILKAGGAPVTVQQLGLSPDHLRRSFVAAREIRGRFSVLDFAADLGVLESVADEVLRRSGCLG